MPQLIIIPITKIQELCDSKDDLREFFKRVPLISILDIIIDLEKSTDISTALWEEVEHKLTDDEIERIDLIVIDFLFEIIIEMFYEELYKHITRTDMSFRIHHWFSDSVCLLPSKHNVIDTDNYPASDF